MSKSRENRIESGNDRGSSDPERFNPKSLAIVTTVHYPKWYPGEVNWDDQETLTDKTRGDSALQMIALAQSFDYSLFVIDSEASEPFTQELINLEIKRFAEKPGGMSAGRQQGFKEASGTTGIDFVCWIEPEKIDLINFMPDLVKPLTTGEADIVVPKRREKEFIDTYPGYQVDSEKKANRLWNNMLKKFGILPENSEELDVLFGPKIYRNIPEVAELFQKKYRKPLPSL